MSTIEENINKIKTELRRTMNGIAAKAIKESGAGYKLSYGTPINEIKKIANNYEKDDELAERLWESGVREEMMLATMLWESTNKELAEKCAKESQSLEMLMQISRNMTSHEIDGNAILEWVGRGNDNLISTGFLIAAQMTSEINTETKEKLLNLGVKAAEGQNYIVSKCVAEYIKSYYREDRTRKKRIETEIERLSRNENVTARLAYEDIMTEINYG